MIWNISPAILPSLAALLASPERYSVKPRNHLVDLEFFFFSFRTLLLQSLNSRLFFSSSTNFSVLIFFFLSSHLLLPLCLCLWSLRRFVVLLLVVPAGHRRHRLQEICRKERMLWLHSLFKNQILKPPFSLVYHHGFQCLPYCQWCHHCSLAT